MFKRIAATGAVLLAVSVGSAYAQDAGTTTTTRVPADNYSTTTNESHGFNPGWLGLLGLAGLAGLMPRKREVVAKPAYAAAR